MGLRQPLPPGIVFLDAANVGAFLDIATSAGLTLADLSDIAILSPDLTYQNAAQGYYDATLAANAWFTDPPAFVTPSVFYASEVPEQAPPTGLRKSYRFTSFNGASDNYSTLLAIPDAWLNLDVWISLYILKTGVPNYADGGVIVNEAWYIRDADGAAIATLAAIDDYGLWHHIGVSFTWTAALKAVGAGVRLYTHCAAAGSLQHRIITGIRLVQSATAPGLEVPSAGVLTLKSGTVQIVAGTELQFTSPSVIGLQEQVTVGGAGGAAALPATPRAWIQLNGLVVPGFNPA